MAKVKVLLPGYTTADSVSSGQGEKTRATVTLVRDKNIIMVCDPGVLDSPQILLDTLKGENISANDVNYVFITHSHLDHYRNIGLFPRAKILEYYGVWDGEKVSDWPENFTADLKIIKTPGHNYDGLTLLVKTEDGVIAICGDVFWQEDGPASDPYASDQKKLEASRKKILVAADFIVPGHADMYSVK